MFSDLNRVARNTINEKMHERVSDYSNPTGFQARDQTINFLVTKQK